ncbi:MAG: carboxypeptidase regulatory-like domain-containing protein [Pirellula sp.]
MAHEFYTGSHPVAKYTVGVFLLAMLLGGCGGASDVGTVSGIVTLDGSPLEGASITFLPEKGRPSSGGTDKNGHYKLSYSNDQSGAILGDCQVTITTAFEGQDGKQMAEKVPKKYRAPGALQAIVKPGSNKLNFDLLSK